MEKRITELETKVSYQDQVIEDLNQLVIQQQKQLDLLTESCKKLESQATSASGVNVMDSSLEVPPPHY